MQFVIGDGVLHCQVLGDGPPILFIHGFPLSHEMWLPVADQLRDRWRCILPDLRGHGRSAVSPEVTITQFADDLAALLDAISETRPVVPVGLSMGGVIALEFFRQQRARLRALVLANCRANAETPEGIARRAALAQSVLRDGSQVAADAMIGDLFAPAAPAGLRSEWRARIARTPPAGVAAASRALAGRRESFSTLHQIDCPTLVIAGAADTITPPDGMQAMHAMIPGSRYVVIPGAGHLTPIEQPATFATALREFVSELP